MARPLRVKRLDSPLARNGVTSADRPAEEPVATDTDADQSLGGAAPEAPPVSVEKEERLEMGETPTSAADHLPPPPSFEEPLEFVSGRVPASLAQRLNTMTLALRQRQRTRASQKGLPQQEVLAVILWALGDPDDADAVDELADLHAHYRAGRYAAAADQLGGSA